jgi:hypothetical protein
MAIRFLIDENMPGAVERAILRHNRQGIYVIDMMKVGDAAAPPKGTHDPELLMWLEGAGRILVSYDKKTLLMHFGNHLAAGHHVPGIFLFKTWHALQFIVDYMAAVAHASTSEEWVDRIVIVD